MYLPIIPAFSKRSEKCSVLLTDRNKSDWKFLFRSIDGISSAFDENQDFDFSSVDESSWQDVVVPSSLSMQGFDIENNVEYYYKRNIRIPAYYKDKNIYLRFEGVYSNARVWINHKFCASHVGGFTAWDVDITEFVDCNEVTLVVGVADVEGSKISPWNTDGAYQSNSAWASYYAHHNIGGIIRDINMYCLPKQSILQTHIDTVLNGSTSTAKISMRFSENCVGLKIKAEIVDGDKVKAAKEMKIKDLSLSFDLNVVFAERWDAEHPNLYVLKTTLFDEKNNFLQTNTVKFGFREITYGGKNGTDKNKIYVNGREIKLRGVCRHDVSARYGRSVTKEEIYNEIKTYKEHNINHIRTSHYPAGEYMLEVCDELGMYVEQENAACFKGANGFDIYNPPVDFLNSFKEMVEFSRNHPSVIIWSIANESGFEKSSGFRDCYNYIKKTDLTRPIIFSYPDTVKSKPLPYDVYSKHYAKVTSNLGKNNVPLLHDEFAHVPCYNIDDLKCDNSSRVFWGESIKRGWDNIFDTPGALGCDIWAAVDDVFYLKNKSMEKHQTHLPGECSGYGEWGCIFDAFKRLKPEAYLTKKAFTPVNIKETTVFGDEIRFDIQNRFDHSNFNELYIRIKDKNSNIIYRGKIKESVEPHSRGIVSVYPLNCVNHMTVEFVFQDIVVESVVLNQTDDSLKLKPSPIRLQCAQNRLLVSFKDEQAAVIRSMHLYTGLNKFDVLSCELSKCGDHTYSADFGFGRTFLLSVSLTDNVLNFKIQSKNTLSALYLIGELGVDMELADDFKSVSWIRKSLYNHYPENHIARPVGTAFKSGVLHGYDDKNAGRIQWEQDMSAFAYYEKASKCNQTAGNDFRTKRLRIYSYLVNLENDSKVLVHTESNNINAYANPFNSKLQISKGYYKQSILWGNYWGERYLLNKNNSFEFSVSFEKQR